MTTGIVLTQSGDGMREFGRALIAACPGFYIETALAELQRRRDEQQQMEMILHHACELFDRANDSLRDLLKEIADDDARKRRMLARPPAIPRKARRKMARKWAR